MPKTIELGYECRWQFAAFHLRQHRWACIVAHRRAGKTVACVMDLLHRALMFRTVNGRFGYVAPFYNQAKDAAWTYLKMYAAKVPGATINESELRVDFAHNGARIRLYGADNYDRMRGAYFDGVILDEYGDMDPRAWPEVIRPMLADRKGWAVFIGTPKGRNDFFEKFQEAKASGNWFAMVLKASQSELLDADELADVRETLTPEQYAQEMECDFSAAVVGSYYGKEITNADIAGRICDVDVDPNLPVNTAWDLGIGDSTAIWAFQTAPDGLRIVDYYESHGQPLLHYINVLAAKPWAKQWAEGKTYLPHDAMARELGTGRTRLETLKMLDAPSPQIVPNHTVDDGINAARISFENMWIDRTRCKDGLEALRQYRTEFDDKRKVFKARPLHDWTSHAADAFRYMAMAWRELKPEPKPAAPKVAVMQVRDGRLKSNMGLDARIQDFLKRKGRQNRAA